MNSIFRFTMIPLIALLGFVFGCNSHASFEYSLLLCGNHQLDGIEECDYFPNGTVFFANAATCKTLGFDGGQLKCYDCEFDTGNCYLGEDCDPINDSGCDDIYCFYFQEEDATHCGDQGYAEEGQPCESSLNCDVRMTCFDAGDEMGPLCRRVCQPGDTCLNEQLCQELGWLDGSLGLCPLSAGGCNPVTNEGCYGEEGCYLESGMGGGRCMPAGDGQVGDPCGANFDCTPGHVCLKLLDPTQGFCTRLCDSNVWCDGGSGWCGFYPGTQAGICTEPSSCDPFSGIGCPDTQVCTITNPNGHYGCMLSTNIGEGGDCDMFTRCHYGLYCATELDHKCHKVCNSDLDCTGQTCTTIQAWVNNDVATGYCQ